MEKETTFVYYLYLNWISSEQLKINITLCQYKNTVSLINKYVDQIVKQMDSFTFKKDKFLKEINDFQFERVNKHVPVVWAVNLKGHYKLI